MEKGTTLYKKVAYIASLFNNSIESPVNLAFKYLPIILIFSIHLKLKCAPPKKNNNKKQQAFKFYPFGNAT